jgi:threonine synthase
MTNAVVEGVVAQPHGAAFMVVYKDQKTELVVGPDTPVVTTAPGDRSLLKPGAAVVVTARKDPAGQLVALRITAEKDGTKPPM